MTNHTLLTTKQVAKERQEHRDRMRRIAYDYVAFLEPLPNRQLVDILLLPYPKRELITSLLFSISYAQSQKEIRLLSDALNTLALAQDIGEYDTLSAPNPSDFNELETDEGIRRRKAEAAHSSPIYRRHQEDIDKELASFREWTERAIVANKNVWPFYRRWWNKLESYVLRQSPGD